MNNSEFIMMNGIYDGTPPARWLRIEGLLQMKSQQASGAPCRLVRTRILSAGKEAFGYGT